VLNVAPIPLRAPLFAEPSGRPVDWWEPLRGTVAEVAARLGGEAKRRRLPVDLLAALLVEHALIIRDIADCRIDREQARTALADAAAARVASGPGRLHTFYVRTLQTGERGCENESDAELARRNLVLPLRLHEAACGLELVNCCRIGSLDEAIAWVIAAATSGQFMREWALRMLLAAAGLQPTLG
jgi:hypothetical protein